MSKMQRTKGASAERELCHLIHEHLGVKLVRNLEQSRKGGHDLIPDPEATGPVASQVARYAFEVKRHARATPALLKGWWSQTADQAARAGLLPCLCYRADRQDWRVVIPLSVLHHDMGSWQGLDWTAELSLPGWCALMRELAGPPPPCGSSLPAP